MQRSFIRAFVGTGQKLLKCSTFNNSVVTSSCYVTTPDTNDKPKSKKDEMFIHKPDPSEHEPKKQPGAKVIYPTPVQKFFLVFSRMYRSFKDIPPEITLQTWHKAQDRSRVLVMALACVGFSVWFSLRSVALSRKFHKDVEDRR